MKSNALYKGHVPRGYVLEGQKWFEKHLSKDKLHFFLTPLLMLFPLGKAGPSGQIFADTSVHKVNEKPGKLVERIY